MASVQGILNPEHCQLSVSETQGMEVGLRRGGIRVAWWDKGLG